MTITEEPRSAVPKNISEYQHVEAFSDEAKQVRHFLYQEYLTAGRCSNLLGVAKGTGLSYSSVVAAVDELERGLIVMSQPGVPGLVAKCPPWTNLPTSHVGRVEGSETTVFVGCAFEALNLPFCYPGKVVTITSACPHCGDEIGLELREDEILSLTAPDLVIHIGVDPDLWMQDWFVGCAYNNFFSSAAHAAEWESSHPKRAGAVLTLDTVREVEQNRNRLAYDRGGESSPAHFGPFLQERGLSPEAWRKPR